MLTNVYIEEVTQENDDALTTYRILKNDTLGVCLVEFFGSDKEVVKHLRNGKEDNLYFYFDGGYGYNIIDQDMLNGDGSGKTKKDFETLYNVSIHY